VNEDQVEGTVTNLKGQVKEGVGSLTGDEDLQAEGQADQLVGNVQKAVGDVEETLRETGEAAKQGVEDLASKVDLGDAQAQADQVAEKVQQSIGGVKERLRPATDAIKQATGMTDGTLMIAAAVAVTVLLAITIRLLRGRGA
jgi:uncharacterized protein YjbJ (UPF0337 family)